MKHKPYICEDEDDARRMSENILRKLGYVNMNSGSCAHNVNTQVPISVLMDIARNAERIARWARAEVKTRNL